MRDGLKKIFVLVLSAALIGSTPSLSHSQMDSAVDGTHEVHAIVHYADLLIESANEECPHAMPAGSTQPHDNSSKKCCAACLGAILIPAIPFVASILSKPSDIAFAPEDSLLERTVPTEPGIPKTL
jgi:hypothetical protein